MYREDWERLTVALEAIKSTLKAAGSDVERSGRLKLALEYILGSHTFWHDTEDRSASTWAKTALAAAEGSQPMQHRQMTIKCTGRVVTDPIQIHKLEPAELDELWQGVEPFVVRDVLQGIEDGHGRPVQVERAAFLSEIDAKRPGNERSIAVVVPAPRSFVR